MSEPVLRTIGLSKRYGRRLALSDLTLDIPRGTVYGFLGPNGAGKTTAINLVLGLIAPTAGHVELFGLDTRTHLTEALRRTGSLLEGSQAYPDLSARDNLRIWAALSGGATRERIASVLETVDLAARAGDKVRSYSLGMRQRLALAAALLHDPEFLVLDEPTNGLDPAGIREVRELLRSLAADGRTVFVSSHLLSEVEQMCDEVAIIKEGRLIAHGAVADLTHRSGVLELRVTDTEKALAALQALDWVPSVTADGRDGLVVEAPPERAWELSRALAEQRVYISEMRPRESTLEDFFLEVTGEEEKSG
ncbi:MAG: ABC transporter ATP-binding protein [Dehalococcoidia bacterium]|nr:ABC transporter ATP-binding protein [Dehalococcoidia bacterium]